MKAACDPAAARQLQETGVALTRAGVQELRQLAAGIHPGILTDRGLGPAVEAIAHRAPLPVTVVQTLDRRLPAAVETSIYFLVSEALTNVVKHAQADEAWVRIGTQDGRLIVDVADDGIGGATATSAGVGLAGLADRVAALDGELTIISPPAQGTTLHVAIPELTRDAVRDRSLAWAAYAASAWALAYAIGVRAYQGLGGTLGLAGTFADPAGMRRASLLAGALIALVGLGALGLVRPWGLRLPRWLIIIPALTGSAYAVAHALTAYVTKPLHLLGVIELEFRGWAELDEDALIRWDLLFYEPWFLGLGVLVTLGTLHHFRRTGGSPAGARRLLVITATATLASTAYTMRPAVRAIALARLSVPLLATAIAYWFWTAARAWAASHADGADYAGFLESLLATLAGAASLPVLLWAGMRALHARGNHLLVLGSAASWFVIGAHVVEDRVGIVARCALLALQAVVSSALALTRASPAGTRRTAGGCGQSSSCVDLGLGQHLKRDLAEVLEERDGARAAIAACPWALRMSMLGGPHRFLRRCPLARSRRAASSQCVEGRAGSIAVANQTARAVAVGRGGRDGGELAPVRCDGSCSRSRERLVRRRPAAARAGATSVSAAIRRTSATGKRRWPPAVRLGLDPAFVGVGGAGGWGLCSSASAAAWSVRWASSSGVDSWPRVAGEHLATASSKPLEEHVHDAGGSNWCAAFRARVATAVIDASPRAGRCGRW